MKKRVPTEQEIARKHGVSIKYVIRQAEIGSTVEREHVTDHKTAYGIALQHIAEFPNYYQNLLPMEKKLKQQWANGKRRKTFKEFKEHCGLPYYTADHQCEKCNATGMSQEGKECKFCNGTGSLYEMPVKKVEENHIAVAMGKEIDDEGGMIMSQLDTVADAVERLREVVKDPKMQLPGWVQSKITLAADYIDTAADYMSSKNEEVDLEEGAAWTRKSGQNKNGGLNEKGRKSYERENPGSDLKAPSKKVGNPRRASFCARMKGMKSKLTSKKTANDPDSRINKSLRAWNC